MDMKALIADTARKYGEDPDTALRIAYIESKYDPRAQNPSSSAGGLFQFIDGTWKNYGQGKHKYDPQANADAGIRLMRDNRKFLEKRLGREVTPGELYLAHQQGAGGALKILSADPNANAMSVLGRDQVRLNGGNESMTVGQFKGLWDGKMGSAQTTAPGRRAPGSPTSEAAAANNTFTVDNPSATVTPYDITPNVTSLEREREQVAAVEAAQAEAPGYLEAAWMSVQADTSIAAPWRMLGGQELDPDWRLSKEWLDTNASDIPDEYLEELRDGTVSEQHANAILNRVRKFTEIEQEIGKLGWQGVAVRMAVGALDPGAWAASAAIVAASGGLATPAALAARFGKIGAIGYGAATAAAGNALADGTVYATNPAFTKEDLMISVGVGAMLGAGFGSLSKVPTLAPERATFQDGATRLREAGQVSRNDPTGNLGAAGVTGQRKLGIDQEDLYVEYETAADTLADPFNKYGRIDLANTGKTSPNATIRSFASVFYQDAAGNRKGMVTPHASTENQRLIQRTHDGAFTTNWETEYAKWQKDPVNAGKSEKEIWDSLNREASDYARETTPAIAAQASPIAKKFANFATSVMDSLHQRYQDAGVAIKTASNYLPRYKNLANFEKMHLEDGVTEKQFIDIFANAIAKATPNIPEPLRRKWARAMVRDFHEASVGGGRPMGRGWAGEDLDDMSDMMRASGMSDSEIKQIVDTLNARASDTSVPDRAKGRVIMDELEETVVILPNGTQKIIRPADFYLDDLYQTTRMYIREMSGNIALAETRIKNQLYDPTDPNSKEFLVDGFKSKTDIENFITDAKKVHDEAKAQGKPVGKWEDEEGYIRDGISIVMGKPLAGQDHGTTWAKFLRTIRGFNFLRLMGQVGLAQIPESGRTASLAGWKTTLRSVPEARRIAEQIRTGNFSTQHAAELMAMNAPGTEWYRHYRHMDFEESGVAITYRGKMKGLDKTFRTLDKTNHTLARYVNKFSGMNMINRELQVLASYAMNVKMVKIAKGMENISDKRLAFLGLTRSDLADIANEINTRAVFRNNDVHQIEKFDLINWPSEVRRKFELAQFRAATSAVLENDPGQMSRWMMGPNGLAIMQFRSFMVGSYTKATLAGLNMRDVDAAMAWLTASFIGGMVYMGQTYMNSIGREDQQAFLDKRLDPIEIGKAAFMRASEASVIPMAVDSLWELGSGGDPFFAYQRSTGLAGSIMGNPTVDFISDAQKGIKGVTSALFRGDDFSRQDADALLQLTPFYRSYGVSNFYAWLLSGLPKERKEF